MGDGGRSLRAVLALAYLCAILASASDASAQIVHDGSLGPSGTVSGPDHVIAAENGARAGANLFHSFSEFDLATGATATFTGPADVGHVVSRVTGGEPSTIDGLVRSTMPTADFWFVNPAGIVVGPNGRFDVPAGLHIGAADAVAFADGSAFAADPDAGATLATAAPEAFGFAAGGGDLRLEGTRLEPAGDLTLAGAELVVADTDILATAPATLRLEGTTLRLTDSFVALDNPDDGAGGVVELTADTIGVTRSEVSAVGFGAGPSARLDLEGEAITFDGGSLVFTRSFGGGAGGDIDVRADGLALRSGAVLATVTDGGGGGGQLRIDVDQRMRVDAARVTSLSFGSGTAGDLSIAAAEMAVARNGLIDTRALDSGALGTVAFDIATQLRLHDGGAIVAENDGAGAGGRVRLRAAELLLQDGGQIFSTALSAFASARGSDVEVDVDRLRVEGAGGSPDPRPAAIATLTAPFAAADAGDVTIDAEIVALRDGGQITSETLGAGAGGNVTVRARQSFTMRGPDGAAGDNATAVSVTTAGQSPTAVGGDLVIAAERLEVTGASAIAAQTQGVAPGGNIRFDVGDSFLIDGALISGNTSGPGRGGDVVVDRAPNLQIRNGGQIATGPSRGQFTPDPTDAELGRGGDIRVEVGRLRIDAGDADPLRQATGLVSLASDLSFGAAGDIDVDADVVELVNGGVISAQTLGFGAGGEVAVDARTAFVATGATRRPPFDPSGVFASTAGIVAAAVGGDVRVAAPAVTLADGATITAASEGIADAGGVRVRGRERVELRDASIATSSPAAGGGRIEVFARDRLQLEDSRIESSVAGARDTTAGDIAIDPRFVILNDSAILARATAGTGGNIGIEVGTLILSPGSRIDASAETGIDGTVETGSPAEDVSGRIVQLPAQFRDPNAILRAGCDARNLEAASTFVVGAASGPPAVDGPLIAGYAPDPARARQGDAAGWPPVPSGAPCAPPR